MATLDVVTRGNEKAGTVDLDPSIFEAAVRPHLFHAEVRRQLALRRAGTHSTRNRAGVSGGGKKPYRQKGTGRARQGTIRAPQWAGGGAVFGPVPRGYAHSLPKKVRRAALVSALSTRFAEDAITVVDGLELEGFRTREVVNALDRLGLAGASVLIVIGEANEKVEVSARNIPRVAVVRAEGLNVYDVLRHDKLLLTRGAVDAVERRLQGFAKGTAGAEGDER
jgi:large subunit ribosomal protein L4